MDKWRDSAAEYALGTLSTAERAEFELHLLGCADCTAEVRAFSQVTAVLAHAAPQPNVNPAVRTRVVETARRAAGDVLNVPALPTAIVSQRTPWTPWLAVAAAMILAIGLGGYALSLRRAASEARTVVVVLAASDLVRVELAGQPVAPRAAARAFWSRSRGLVFTASNLPLLASGRTYQLWIISGQTPIGAGLLKPGADGLVHAVFITPADLSNAVAMAVTIEPDGGMPAPTGDKYLVGLVN